MLAMCGLTAALILVAIPCRPLMLLVEGLIAVLNVGILVWLIVMLCANVYVFVKNGDVATGLQVMGINILAVVFGLVVIGYAGLINPDPYAMLHPIPDDIEYEIPTDDAYPPVVETDSTTWLQVRTSYIGCFSYLFYYGPLPEGVIFLRCFEAGTNAPLSADKIEAKTTCQTSPADSFTCHVSNCDFTIFEGAPEQYYVARIEVWFRDAQTHQERKLGEKYYQVDGYEH